MLITPNQLPLAFWSMWVACLLGQIGGVVFIHSSLAWHIASFVLIVASAISMLVVLWQAFGGHRPYKYFLFIGILNPLLLCIPLIVFMIHFPKKADPSAA